MAHEQRYDEDDPWLGRLRAHCERLPGCHEQVAHGRPTFRAGEKGKVFAYFGGAVKTPRGVPHEQHEAALLFLPDPAERRPLEDDARTWLPAYLGPSGWLGIDLDRDDVGWDEVAELLDASYRQVAGARLVGRLDAPRLP